ncbi:hypothetical protein HUJ05_008191 [Dendroctonus ponderosae]|nr:hypothetical protein HUJ05_008191 [Dendroctonus ponderosae]
MENYRGPAFRQLSQASNESMEDLNSMEDCYQSPACQVWRFIAILTICISTLGLVFAFWTMAPTFQQLKGLLKAPGMISEGPYGQVFGKRVPLRRQFYRFAFAEQNANALHVSVPTKHTAANVNLGTTKTLITIKRVSTSKPANHALFVDFSIEYLTLIQERTFVFYIEKFGCTFDGGLFSNSIPIGEEIVGVLLDVDSRRQSLDWSLFF